MLLKVALYVSTNLNEAVPAVIASGPGYVSLFLEVFLLAKSITMFSGRSKKY